MVSDARELEELRSVLPNWLHNIANVFSKKAVDTLPQPQPFDYKLRFNRLEPLITLAHLYRISTPELEKM
jgi:hypothetical protein